MGQDFTAVNAFPQKGVKREAIVSIPGQFLGEKAVASGFTDDLRQSSRISECIGQPEIFHLNTEFIFKEIFSVKELPDQRFTSGKIDISFYPHASKEFPFSGFDRLFYSAVYFRIKLFDGRINCRLGSSENIIRITLHQMQLSGKGAGSFVSALFYLPEPADIEVGVSERPDFQRG